jgi:hypothetical protein
MAAKPKAAATAETKTHDWRFFRSGGVDQVRIDRGSDIANLKHLDQKLWVALSCPVKGLEFDEVTLGLLDTDKDGRVRAPELLNAIDWAIERLESADTLVAGSDSIPLAGIQGKTDEGKQLRACAKRVLSGLGKGDATSISVADVVSAEKELAKLKLNGDGVLPAASLDDAAAKQVVVDAIACLGGVKDRGGEMGVDAASLAAFYSALEAHSKWVEEGAARAAELLPAKDGTGAANDAVKAIRGKVDDFFARCRLAAYDERALAALVKRQDDHFAAAASDMTISLDELAELPVARVAAGAALPLVEGVNPAHAPAIATLATAAVAPILGKKTELTEADWIALQSKLAPYDAWLARKAGAEVERLGAARIRAILTGGERAVIEKLLAEDAMIAAELSKVAALERLTRFARDLLRLLNNFVAFTDFYSRRNAIFQAGTLYLDTRSCSLCVKVDSPDKHASLAMLAKTYLAYCECSRPATGQKMMIAAAFTAGDSDHLMVGRNGVFYDKAGRDWDATIVKILDQPISLGQAFWAPYKRLLRFIEEQVNKKASAADAAATEKLQAGAVATADAAKGGAAPAPKPKIDIGIVAALGVAVGAILGAFTTMVNAFFGLGMFMPLGVVAVILGISGPSLFIAWLKLRQRNLGPILDATGWAINGRAMVNIPLGQAFTDTAKLPPGAERSLVDPYAEAQTPWVRYTIQIVLVVLLVLGFVYRDKVADYWHQFRARIENPSKPPEDPGATPPATEPPPVK